MPDEAFVVVVFHNTFNLPEKNLFYNKERNSCSTKQVLPPRTTHPARGGAPDSLTDCSRFAFCSPACGPFIKHVSAFQRRLGPLVAYQTPARRPRAPDKRLDHLEGRRRRVVHHACRTGSTSGSRGRINGVALITVAGFVCRSHSSKILTHRLGTSLISIVTEYKEEIYYVLYNTHRQYCGVLIKTPPYLKKANTSSHSYQQSLFYIIKKHLLKKYQLHKYILKLLASAIRYL